MKYKKELKLSWTIIKEIVFPIIIILLPLFWNNCQKSIIEIFETFVGNEWKVTSNIVIFISLSIYLFIFIINRKCNREFLKGDVYGSKHIIFYYIAIVLGYKKISLIRKPYNIIFKILKKGIFEIIPDNIEDDDEVEAYVDYSNFIDSNNLRECNLIIEDTYEISKEQIPEDKRNIDTIRVYRDKSNKVNNRVFSSKLLTKIGEALDKAQSSGAIINLYLTTNTKTTKEMIENVLMKGDRSLYKIRLFLQSDSGKREFIDKGIKV